jgi:phosphoesterase RecJ-like protein
VLASVEGAFDVAVLTDCPNPDRTEGLLGLVRPAARRIVNIDHHPDNRAYGHVNWIDPAAAATGELVYELLLALGWPISPAVATNLFTAVHTDTGSFRYSNVTPATFRIAAALVEPAPTAWCRMPYERRRPEAGALARSWPASR